MRNGVIAVLLVVVIMVSAGAGYFMGNSARSVTTSVSTTTLSVTEQSVSTATSLITRTTVSPTTVVSTALSTVSTTVFSFLTTTSPQYEPCGTPVSNESLVYPFEYGNATTFLTPVLLMRPNTTGYVCVAYQTFWRGNQSQFLSYGSTVANVTDSFEYSGNPLNWKCITYNESSMSCTLTYPHAFTIQHLPSSVVLTGDLDYLIIVYAYTALSNSTGFYDETAPWWGCWGMPMAVGYPASQVNATDFNFATTLSECPPVGLNPVAEYTTGMNVTYVNITPIPSA
jgi:hypothetical protein